MSNISKACSRRTVLRAALFAPAASVVSGGIRSASAASPEERGLAIAKDVDDTASGWKGELTELSMAIFNAQNERIERRMLAKIREVGGDGDRSVITFDWPADVKGTRLLTWTHKTADDDQWLYLPTTNRILRISSRNKSGSFMGSEFAYEDLVSQELEKYRFLHLGDEQVNGRPSWKVQRTPLDSRSGYSKHVVWYDHEYKAPVKVAFFDRKGDLLKVAEWQRYQKLQRWWRAESIKMVNAQTRKYSVMQWSSRKLGVSFKDSEFQRESLED